MSNSTLTEYRYKYLFHYVKYNNNTEHNHRIVKYVEGEFPSEKEITDLENELTRNGSGQYDVVGFYRLSSC